MVYELMIGMLIRELLSHAYKLYKDSNSYDIIIKGPILNNNVNIIKNRLEFNSTNKIIFEKSIPPSSIFTNNIQ